jgi:hypothetical protein
MCPKKFGQAHFVSKMSLRVGWFRASWAVSANALTIKGKD